MFYVSYVFKKTLTIEHTRIKLNYFKKTYFALKNILCLPMFYVSYVLKKNFNNRTCPKLIGPTIDFLIITAKPNNTH